ncbi:transposase [Desulforamulus aquiferis]|uniref:Transposase n=1 Tax=Desulforamulus aquiferis TaxID=1397668 RepID=A0AAW7ZAP5_9FIRM|nr:transposase [Desulforamulus aquiferis]MDO7785910.1 transposase [Desulforamulus aquiferis]RYD02120.1 hypothetical protein N752_27095 [Desulforamulus aquiferis]
MARQARKKSDSGIYHLILRGNNRQNIFEADEDRTRFIDTIRFYKKICNYELFGYCLMNNHIHLLIKENGESVSKIVKRISSSYVSWYNQKYARCGHLFQERFRSEAVETDEYFLTVLRYIHQNPLKAGITEDMEKYVWSSYREYMGNSDHVEVDFAFSLILGDKTKSKESLLKFMSEKNDDQCLKHREKIKICDDEVIEYLKKLGILNVSELQRIEIEKRNEIIRIIKRIEGITIRQIARITGIPKSVVDRI